MPTINYKLPHGDEDVQDSCPLCDTPLSTEGSIYVPIKLLAKRVDGQNLSIELPENIEDSIVSTELECAKCGEYV